MKGIIQIGKWRQFWFIGVFFLLLLEVSANPLLIKDSSVYTLGKFIYYLEDNSNLITIDDIIQGKLDSKFQLSQSENPNFGFRDSTFWAKISIENTDANSTKFYLEQAFPPIDFLEVYYLENGVLRTVTLGDNFPFYQRKIIHRNFVIPLDIHTNEVKTLIIKMKTKSVSVFRMTLYPDGLFHAKTANDQLFFGFFYGIFLILILKNIFLFLILREKLYIHYVFFAIAIGMYFWVFNGFGFQYFWSNQIRWNDIANPFFMILTIFSGIRTSIHFLEIDRYSSFMRKVLDLLSGLSFLNLLLLFIIPYKYAVYYIYIIIFPVSIAIFICAVISLVHRSPLAKFFSVGYISLMISALFVAFNNLGFLANYASPVVLQIASCIAICILSLGLSNRYYVLRQQKLEIESNALQINTRLNRIQNELEIAKKIHESLLPSKLPDLQKVNLSAKYIPSSEIGGDFYDYHLLDGKHLGVFIADVTGHGVPAALFASIVKFTFSRELENSKHPSKLLANMNSSLFERIGNNLLSAGYLYLDIINRSITYASCGHPPLLIWKREEKEFIELKPRGRLIGVSREIVLFDSIYKLEVGDRILFYTDGLWECENQKGIPFGQTQLARFAIEKEDLPATEFSDALVQALHEYSASKSFMDDVTFIVIDIT